MIAPDPKLVRRLRRQVRAAVKASPMLRRDHKRAVKSHHEQRQVRFIARSMGILPRVLVTFSILGLLVAKDSVAIGGLLLVLWSAIVTIFRAANFANVSPASLGVFFFLPVSSEDVFRHRATLAFRASLWLGLDWLAFGLVLAAQHGGAVAWLVAPLFAAAQWAVSLGIAALLSRHQRVLSFTILGGMLCGLAGFIALKVLGDPNAFARYVEPVLRAVTRVTPAGWLASAQANVLAGGWSGWAVVLALGGGGVALLKAGVRRLRAEFSLERIFGYGHHDEAGALRWIGAEEDADAPAEEPLPPAEPPPSVDLPAMRAKLRDTLDAPPGLALFRRGWLESVATRALPERQRVLVDFLQPGGLRAAGGWKTALVLMTVAQLLRLAGLDPAFAAMLTAGALGCFLLPTFGGLWAGLANRVTPHGSIGFSAFFPVGLGEIARGLLMVNAIRAVAALPVLLLAMRFGFTATPLPWPEALGFALRTLAIVLALQPVWAVVAFSKSSNDSSTPGWLAKLLLLALVVGVLTLPVFGVAMFFVQSGGKALFCAAVLLGLSHALLAFYGWAWGRNFFDLVARPPLR
jgi:hypothetical protein